MMQIDAVWVYGIGAGFALADAPRGLRARAGHASPAFGAALGYLVVFFVPCGLWLLTDFPRWETMHVLSSAPGWCVAAFCGGAAVLGAAGFVCTGRLLAHGRVWSAFLQWVWPHAAVFFLLLHGWDGTGLRRFLTTGPGRFDGGEPAVPLVDHVLLWLSSPVALTLAGMGVVVVPVQLWLLARCRAAALPAPSPRAGWRLAGLLAATVFGPCLAVAALTAVAAHTAGPLPAGCVVSACLVVAAWPPSGLARWAGSLILPAGPTSGAFPRPAVTAAAEPGVRGAVPDARSATGAGTGVLHSDR
ncbi:hypothetical protein AB0K93_27060 [Streptomyces sp. NPDC052676]|uniref:hypothetical protein n=1 Tax=Streptomyces sp. NPDC052676 TaxID=3154953 RepID=UPI003442F36C